ncbi:class I SAM-dependent methyltransferase [Chitinophaga silvatica]|uniref:Class I SAM-dependent methyltransferase n=1 Tax=Chitinophaga silvatica TaxID=2282649 RepID=A0A3E1Y4C5_9BACT|nr:class I SAM-dependent methyltransferase [Chitinophaga silvatica]RFS19513.1 class I SAM-dependent methyltransferase [Chitinophaga silvatica]
MDLEKQYFEANKSLWNQRVATHINSEFYNVPAFKAGTTSLNSIELTELTEVKGKSLLHLQCHFGMDTLSWAREGAIVTGADLSDKAIEQARQLADELQIPATFVCSNIYDLKENLHQQYDIVFTSYGTIGWLPDLDRWASVISHFLRPGGRFYIADFHPVIWMFGDTFQSFDYSYFNTEVIATDQEGTYADKSAPLKGKEYGWNHPISEIQNALIKAGLSISFFNEFDYSPYNCFANTVEIHPGKWQIKGMEGKLPMVYSLMAVKKG